MKTILYILAISFASTNTLFAQASNYRIKATSQYFFNPSTLQNELLDSNLLHYTGSKGSAMINNFVPALLDIYDDSYMTDADSATKNYTSMFGDIKESKINTYHANGKLMKQVVNQFNTNTNLWETRVTKYISYLGNNNIDFIITETPNIAQSAMDSSKKIVSYVAGNVHTIEQLFKEANTILWLPQTKHTITYDNNIEKTILEQTYNDTTGSYQNEMLDVLQYNSNNLLAQDSNFKYDVDNADWLVSGISKIAYNANNTKQSIIAIIFDNGSIDSIKSEFIADANGNIIKEISNQNFAGQWIPLFTSHYFYEWKPVQIPSAIKTQNKLLAMNVFPNPAATVINIQWSGALVNDGRIIITDMQGKQVYDAIIDAKQSANQKQISIEHLPSGLYCISMQYSNSNFICKKFSKW